MLAYCATMALGFKVADLHQIVIGIVWLACAWSQARWPGKRAASRMPRCSSLIATAARRLRTGPPARRAG